MNGKTDNQRAGAAATASLPDGQVRSGDIAILQSNDLFSGSREVIIQHQGEHYRLRCTSKGKLLLTK